jgi:hypothetical protein
MKFVCKACSVEKTTRQEIRAHVWKEHNCRGYSKGAKEYLYTRIPIRSCEQAEAYHGPEKAKL